MRTSSMMPLNIGTPNNGGTVVTGYKIYRGTASGVAANGMSGFTYTVNQVNAKSSTITAAGWTGNAGCWATRKDGSCS